MAKTSALERNEKRRRLVKQKAAKRAKLKAIAKNRNLPPEERFMATLKLAEMPRNSSKVRVRNRCALTGRPRGFYRKLNLSRIALRQLASLGKLPGVTKSSW
ncbi:MAG: 30S ribosomal protein S14 [Alphaproteobacteria bacterium]|nr:30S ribosomal protein S14 [Alphaproteobacteria bacterium]